MSIRSQPGVSSQDIIRVLVVGESENERGEEYAPVAVQIGDPVDVISKPMSGQEKFEQGKTDTTVAYTLYADLAGSEHITEKTQLWHPDESSLNDDETPNLTKNLLDVTGVQRFRFGENITVIEAARSY